MPLYQKIPKQKAVYNGRAVVLRDIETNRGIIKAHLPTDPLNPLKDKPMPQKGGSATSKDSELDKKQLKQKLMQEIYKRL